MGGGGTAAGSEGNVLSTPLALRQAKPTPFVPTRSTFCVDSRAILATLPDTLSPALGSPWLRDAQRLEARALEALTNCHRRMSQPAAKRAKASSGSGASSGRSGSRSSGSGTASGAHGCSCDPHALLDPALQALRDDLVASLSEEELSKPLEGWLPPMCLDYDSRADEHTRALLDLRLMGAGAEGLPE